MAGTLTISTLSDGTNSTSSTNCIQGSAKAWVNFDGTGGPTVRSSFNVSSVTRPSAAVYQVNFTNAMPDANYSAVMSCSGTYGYTFYQSGTNSASTCCVALTGSSNYTYLSVAVFR